MSGHQEGLRALDHVVLPVGALDEARARLANLGFTVAADARHPFGTENACVFFSDDTYLEPLAVASREECEAAARAGNVFVARDQAFRFRRDEGASAIVVKSLDATADHERFGAAGFSAGDMLYFERPMKLPDGTETTAGFRLAFAGDLRAPDFFLFACQRVNALPASRGSLERHDNGVLGISAVVLGEENPSDFQYLLETVFGQREIEAHSFGISLQSANVRIEALTSAGLNGYYGIASSPRGRGLEAVAVAFRVGDIGVTERLLADRGIAFARHGARLVVPPAAGQGVSFVFEGIA